MTFKTEEAQQLPNPDFEDVKFSSIKYANMLSGGRYSQNTVEIYNLQNRTSFDLMTPTAWANVNDKTFCLDASNHNTWYMAPSTYTVEDAYSGAYAVRLDCVGYDLDGPEIPDYLQTSLPFTPTVSIFRKDSPAPPAVCFSALIHSMPQCPTSIMPRASRLLPPGSR